MSASVLGPEVAPACTAPLLSTSLVLIHFVLAAASAVDTFVTPTCREGSSLRDVKSVAQGDTAPAVREAAPGPLPYRSSQASGQQSPLS